MAKTIKQLEAELIEARASAMSVTTAVASAMDRVKARDIALARAEDRADALVWYEARAEVEVERIKAEIAELEQELEDDKYD